MTYRDTQFFYRPECDFYIKQEYLDIIRKLQTFESTESGYCSIMLQWRACDNNGSTYTCTLPMSAIISELFTTMQFIIMCGEMTPEFKLKYDVKPHHESLLRRLYLDAEYDNAIIGGLNTDEYLITTGFKRPFGNSHVLGDVAEELDLNGIDAYDTKDEINQELCEAEYKKFISILREYMREFKMPVYSFSPNNIGSSVKHLPFNWIDRLPYLTTHHPLLYYWKVSQI